MDSKRGTGAVIGWVLLIGFSVSLATMSYIWITQHTEDISDRSIRYVESGLQCENVMINVAKGPSANCELIVTNTRYLNVEQLNVKQLNDSNPQSFIYKEKVIEPKSKDKAVEQYRSSVNTTDYYAGGYCGNISVMPIIIINEELIGCQNRIITVDCGEIC